MKAPIFFLGDVHGNFNYIEYYIKLNKMENCIIYQVGDFGIGFTTEFNDMGILGNLNRFLKERNIHFYAIRGNHDNPAFFDGHLANHFDNLHLLADYDVIEVNGRKILGVGGAISIDRRPCLADMQKEAIYGRNIELYWFDEAFKVDEEKIKLIEGVDILVTHTAPNFCVPINKNNDFGPLVNRYAEYDENLKKDLNEERDNVTKLWELLKEKNPNIKNHFYGHFHRVNLEIINGVEHRLLDINEFYDPKFDYMDDLNKKYDA